MNTYLNTTLELFSDMGATTTIARTTFNSSWESYHDKRQILQNKISLVAKSAGDNALQPYTSYNDVQMGPSLGLKCSHADGSYTQMKGDGLKRFVVGTGKDYHYLTEIGRVSTVGSDIITN